VNWLEKIHSCPESHLFVLLGGPRCSTPVLRKCKIPAPTFMILRCAYHLDICHLSRLNNDSYVVAMIARCSEQAPTSWINLAEKTTTRNERKLAPCRWQVAPTSVLRDAHKRTNSKKLAWRPGALFLVASASTSQSFV
jgi:hypothetical protein